jgi:plastocyanin
VKRRRILAAMATVGGSALAGCSGGGDGATPTATATDTAVPTETATRTGTNTPTPTEADTATATETTTATPATPTEPPTETATDSDEFGVRISNLSFAPVRTAVPPGTTVTWTNGDGVPHDVTATQFSEEGAQWEFSERLSSGARVEYTFEEPGVYQYLCTIHGRRSMCGAVLVGDVSLSSSMPCE